MGTELNNPSFTGIDIRQLFARHEMGAGLTAAVLLLPFARGHSVLVLILVLFAALAVTLSLWGWRHQDNDRPDYLMIFLKRQFLRPHAYNPLEPDTRYEPLPSFVGGQPHVLETQKPR